MTDTLPRPTSPLVALTLLAAAGCAPPADGGFDPEAIRTFLREGIEQSRTMDIGFARAIPDSAFTWAPTADVRNFSEQLAHAANNYWTAGAFGIESPDFGGGQPIETREALVAAITEAYDWLSARLEEIPTDGLDDTVEFFGGTTPVWRVFTQALEHAYWTRGQTVPYYHAHGVAVPGVTFF